MTNETNEIIFGKNSVMEALIAGDREINKILISKNIHSDNKLNKIKELAKENGIIFQFVAKEKFIPYAEFNHQGIIAQISPIKYMDLDDFLDKKKYENASLVILDGVEDSHNLGAIIRTCVCAGVEGIIIPSRRNVQVNATVEKTSAGAINHIPIIKVNSLVNAVQKLKNSDWWVVGQKPVYVFTFTFPSCDSTHLPKYVSGKNKISLAFKLSTIFIAFELVQQISHSDLTSAVEFI
jgi:23S rRNA (guanosine2251-2'-O)-methyltransferase